MEAELSFKAEIILLKMSEKIGGTVGLKEIGVFVKKVDGGTRKALKVLAENFKIFADKDSADYLREVNVEFDEQNTFDILKTKKVIFIFGGDGSVLRVCSEILKVSGANPLVFGINSGRLGFLTFCRADELSERIEDILNERFEIERLKIFCVRDDEGRESFFINDFVISSSPHMSEFSVWVDSEFVGQVRADGFVFSTPLGSTAYNLSAGGPLLHPTVSAVVINFLLPHTLKFRPVVVRDESRVQVEVRGKFISLCDGNKICEKEKGTFHIFKTERFIKIARSKGFFDTLREKLGWI